MHAHGTTRVPIRFDIVGMGEFEATRWVVTITKQGSTPLDVPQGRMERWVLGEP